MGDGQKTRVFGYIRVSSDLQAEKGLSLGAQRARLEAFAEGVDVDLVEIFVDAGRSAKNLTRPGLQAALVGLDEGRAEGLLVVKLDRLTRSVPDLGWLIDKKRFGERWHLMAVSDSIDTRSASGRLILHILGSVSQWEREAIGERTREVMRHLKAQGVVLGAAPLGRVYGEERDASGRRMVRADPEGEAVVRRILELHEQGKSLRVICSALTQEGRKTKRGGRWQPETIRRVIARCENAKTPK